MMAASVDAVEVAVTGKSWMGRRTGSISSMMQEALTGAHDEIQITAYSISENAQDFLDALEKILLKGIRVLLVVNRLQGQPDFVKEKLYELNDRFRQELVLKDFAPKSMSEDLHAKLIVIDHTTALVGSANLTWKGMILNHEIMVRISGRKAWEIGNLVDRLAASRETKTVSKRNR